MSLGAQVRSGWGGRGRGPLRPSALGEMPGSGCQERRERGGPERLQGSCGLPCGGLECGLRGLGYVGLLTSSVEGLGRQL